MCKFHGMLRRPRNVAEGRQAPSYRTSNAATQLGSHHPGHKRWLSPENVGLSGFVPHWSLNIKHKTGWVVEPPLWKIWRFVSWDDDIPTIWKVINVPRHQPWNPKPFLTCWEIVYSLHFRYAEKIQTPIQSGNRGAGTATAFNQWFGTTHAGFVTHTFFETKIQLLLYWLAVLSNIIPYYPCVYVLNLHRP